MWLREFWVNMELQIFKTLSLLEFLLTYDDKFITVAMAVYCHGFYDNTVIHYYPSFTISKLVSGHDSIVCGWFHEHMSDDAVCHLCKFTAYWLWSYGYKTHSLFTVHSTFYDGTSHIAVGHVYLPLDWCNSFALFLYAGLSSYVSVADDRLANNWIDTYLKADVDTPVSDVDTPAADWAAEFTGTHRQQAPNQVIPIEHPWAQDFLGQHEHDVW